MSRTSRAISESGCYHITMRGAGRRILFEDDTDRNNFLSGLAVFKKDGIAIYAWCLMDNHAHLLIDANRAGISAPIHRLCTSYALRFNGRHGHVGPVFQGRFGSFPVESDAHLLETVRYIHFNPKDTGASNPAEYPWSSYREYVGHPSICVVDRVLGMLGGKEEFIRFHDTDDFISISDLTGYRKRLSEGEARLMAEELIGYGFSDRLAVMEGSQRDRLLRLLWHRGISMRQLERLTGIGRWLIRKACGYSRPA